MNIEDQTGNSVFMYIKSVIKNILIHFPSIISKSVNFQNLPLPRSWKNKFSNIHILDMQTIISSEFDELIKYHGNLKIIAVLDNLKKIKNDILTIMDNLPFFAGANNNKTIFNGDIIRELSFYLLLCSFKLYIHAIELVDFVPPEKTETLSESILYEMKMGHSEGLKEQISNLFNSYFKIFIEEKNIFNINNAEITANVLKSKWKETSKITKRRKDISFEDREIETTMQRLKLGKWSVGLSTAIFQYDKDYYDKEREEMNKDFILESQLGINDDVTDMNRDIFRLELIEQQERDTEADMEAYSMSMVGEDGVDDGEDDMYIGSVGD